ncbi:MAG: Hpt domain-containing protein [Dorea sp.]|nr:Hpt domain-containing protein [Dorea sp.]
MTVKECYELIGADYEGVMGRLRTEERVKKFLLKVLNDKSYDLLLDSVESGNVEEAFRAAHTMKGVCQNLSLTPLYESANALAELLRDRKEFGEDFAPALLKVKEDYAQMTAHIKALEG